MKKMIAKLLGVYLNTLAKFSARLAGRHGVKIFCYPFRPSLKSYHKTFLNSSSRFPLTFEGLRLQGYQWGNGEKKVLFLHGWQSHSFRWKNYVQSLSKDEFTVYAFDAPGHGFSQGDFISVPFYSEAIQHFIAKVGPVDTVVSHSIGSFSLVYTLYRLPSLPVNKIVLMAPPGEASDFVYSFKKTLSLSDDAVQYTLAYFKKMFGQSIDYFSVTRFASELTTPCLIIHDEKDEETPYHYARAINSSWKDSVLITTNGLGHNLKSEMIINTVRDFVTGASDLKRIVTPV